MTKNHTTVEFTIEPLENRDAPKLFSIGETINGGAGGPSGMNSWGEYKKLYGDGIVFGQAFNGVS